MEAVVCMKFYCFSVYHFISIILVWLNRMILEHWVKNIFVPEAYSKALF